MSNNASYNSAKSAKYDEFYTQYEDIQKELNHYEKFFYGKTVLCNCDDPFESNFCKFFLRNFNYLGLKRLICTSYNNSPVAGTQLSLFDIINGATTGGHGFVLDVTKVPMANGRGVSDADIDKLLRSKKCVRELLGDGSFDSSESLEYLQQADIVVTNPPFSKFRKYMKVLLDSGKQFLIIGNIGAIGYDVVLDAFMHGKVWIGYECGAKTYRVPDTYDPDKSFVVDGIRYSKMGNTLWYTNLDVSTRHETLILYKRYSPEEYPQYVNYNAIEVDKVKNIPKDYDGLMGVPTSFIQVYNPDQFEILGTSQSLVRSLSPDVKEKGRHAQIGRFFLDDHDGTYKKCTERIVIRNKMPERK